MSHQAPNPFHFLLLLKCITGIVLFLTGTGTDNEVVMIAFAAGLHWDRSKSAT